MNVIFLRHDVRQTATIARKLFIQALGDLGSVRLIHVRIAKQVMEMTHEKTSSFGQFIRHAADLVTSAANEQGILHISQSFAGRSSTSATIIGLVTCPNDLVLEMQRALNQAVTELLAEHGCRPTTVQ